ncbi:Putative cell wall binding repeat 2 [Quadrisphaera granulorum]|uniref:Putative cell wall binding repeat protein n=1 Tax=Quadrisphaera granulorum TaxID=317664 RepID=A0A316A578_9ACTN|nr:putative cell wall binding repeat protein [Quadrisphaera granulorum]SZE97450.1 Putative cell wall binding repeat 2 [Quadrisphaera granulorum]
MSPIAFAKGYPIALTEKDSTSQFTKDELGAIGTDNKILVGGTAVVSDKVAADLSIKSDARVAGADRAVTANLVSDWAKKSEGFNPANAALVGGTNGNGADSLVASALLGKSLTTLHFAGWDATNVYLKDHSAQLTGKGFVFGGTAAVSGDQVNKAQSAAQAVGSMLSASTSDDAIKKVSSLTVSSKANQGAVTYTVSVADTSATVNIGLIDADSVTTVNNAPAFKGSSLIATTLGASIESVNGAVLSSAAASGNTVKTSASAKSGTVTFTVDSVAATKVVPVIWIDKAGGTAASLDFATAPTATSPQVPSETFTLASPTRWIPEDFAGGTVGSDETVVFVNKDAKYFTTANGTYHYDDNDAYAIQATSSVPRGMDYFVSRLTVGDTLKSGSVYAPTAAQQSKFVLDNINPGVLGTLAAASATNSSILVTVPSVASTGSPTVKIYLKEGSGSTITTDDTLAATSTADADSTTAGYQVKLTGLKAGTTYSVAATQTIDGEESTISASQNLSTLQNTVPVSPSVVVSDAQASGASGNGKLSSGDIIEFTFDQAVTVDSGWSMTVRNTTSGGVTNVTLDSSNATVKQLNSGKTLQVKLTDDFPVSGNFSLDSSGSQLVQVASASGIKNDTGAYGPLFSADREIVKGSGYTAVTLDSTKLTVNSSVNATALGFGVANTSGLGSAGSYYVNVFDATTGQLLATSGRLTNTSDAHTAAANDLTLASGVSSLAAARSVKVGIVMSPSAGVQGELVALSSAISVS